jgi:hypothetical protein
MMATATAAKAAGTKVKWTFEADYLQACNCDYGCPCEFEAPPTKGYCEGMGGWRINKGRYGTVSLDGLALGFVARWPQAIHHGNGTAALFFDERATSEQRGALLQIATGQAGGLPFEIIATTFSKVLEPQFVKFQFTINGRRSGVRIGDAAAIEFEPIRNPVTGQPEGVRVEHDTGFIFKSAECVSAKTSKASIGELSFSWPGKAGFVAKVKYGN